MHPTIRATAFLTGMAALLLSTASTHAAPSIEIGQSKFQSVCSACHSLGQGDKVGPDLHGVIQRRGRDWVAAFIRDPAGLLASDATAKALLDKYKTPMPNLGLSTDEVESMVLFLEGARKETGRPPQYLPTLGIAAILVLGLTVIALKAGSKKVEVRP